jgi:phosphatidylinositol dimannoside acyltransferase
MVVEQASYLAYAGGWQAVRHMPPAAAYRMFQGIADLQWRRRTASVRRLEANLARPLADATPEALRTASRAGMRSYMRYWCDAFRLPGWSRAQIGSFRITNEQVLVDAIDSGRGVMLALPHQGNWDHAGAYVSQTYTPIHSVAEKLEPARLFDAFVEFREGLGMRIHGLGNAGVYDELARALTEGGVVALLADRDLSYKGVDVTFLGQAARFPAGPAALVIDTSAILVPVELFWDGGNCATLLPEVVPPAEGTRAERIAATTQAIAEALGEGIRRHPVDWHMLQRLWLADLDQATLAQRDAAHGRGAGQQADGAEVGGV